MIDEKKYVKVISKQPASGVKTAVATNILNQDITITTNGVYRAEAGYTGFGTVTVNVPTEASGSVTFTENGTYDITQYASVTVAVPMNTVSLSVTENGTYTPSGSNIGFSSVSVAVPNQTTSITINYNGTYYPQGPYIGFDSVTVSMHVESLTISPTTSTQTYYGTDEVAGYSPVIVEAVTSAIDSNITPSNIRNGVTILGVTGTASAAPAKFIERILDSNGVLTSAGVSSYINLSGVRVVDDYSLAYANAQRAPNSTTGPATIPDLSGIETVRTRGCNAMYLYCSNSTGSVDLSGLNSVGLYGCQNMFYGCSNITSAYVGDTQTLVNGYGMYGMFYNCVNLSTVLMKVRTLNGDWGMTYIFNNCTHLATCEFDNLAYIYGRGGLSNAFQDCTSLQTVYFPALLSNFTSYTNVFDNMLFGCSNVTVHFPSNLQSVIGSWGSVTNGFSGTNTTVLFDLPATA